MEGRLGFLTKAKRDLPNYNDTPLGPGEYSNQQSLNMKPNFAPFCTTSKRELSVPQTVTPSPGSYEISESYPKSNGMAAGTIFKSKTKRFVPEKPVIGPAPGAYTLQPAIQIKKQMRRSRSQPSHLDSLKQLTSHISAPSIPTKFQSFGYEETEDGDLRLQAPLKPGFTGLRNDAVGPGDYDPQITDSRHHRAPASLFHKGAPRVVGEKTNNIPGPGYYNFKSTFEPLDEGNNDGNFYLRLSQATKRQLSSFESTTNRPSLMGRKIDPNEPGPGSYDIPRNGVEVKKKDPKIQCFDSTVDRFQNPIPRSQRVNTHSGSYNPVTSDFEKNRIEILKKKRMLARSGWAQNVSFESTEERFHQNLAKSQAPPPGTYHPKTSLADNLPRENPRSGAFGSTLKRFYTPPCTTQSPIIESEDIENGFSAYNDVREDINSKQHQHQHPHQHNLPSSKPIKPSRPFANNEDRFVGKKDITNAPPPGTYHKPLSWKVAGVVKIKDHKSHSLTQLKRDTPGPGDYQVGKELLHKGRVNPYFVMGGSNQRFHSLAKDPIPGPGQYDPTPLMGTLLKPTYNAIMVDEISGAHTM